jgi:hypothetical protein
MEICAVSKIYYHKKGYHKKDKNYPAHEIHFANTFIEIPKHFIELFHAALVKRSASFVALATLASLST